MRKVLGIFILTAFAMLGLSSLVLADGGGHEVHKVWVCHELGNGGWNAVEVDQDAWDEHSSGHSGHPNDFLVDDGHPCPPAGEETEVPTEEVTPVVTEQPTEEQHIEVEICHQTGNGWQQLTVDDDAVPGHLGHGDFLVDNGHPCPPDEEPTETPVVTETPTPDVTETPDPEVTETPGPEETETPVPTRRPHNVPTVVVEPGLDQITFWSNIPLTGVGIVVGSETNGWSIVVDSNNNPIVFTVGGSPAIEFRNRWNATIQAYEENVPMVRLVLGRNNSDVNPDHYRAFDWAVYQATGEIVLVNVWTEYQDEHCQVEDFGSGAVCGTSVNWLNGQRWENGAQVR